MSLSIDYCPSLANITPGNALPNPSSSELGSMQTAATSTPSLATGNEVPRTTVRDTSSLLPANKVADTGDDTGTRITVEVPMDTAQPTVSLIHTSSTVMDPSVTPLILGSHASLAHMTTFQPEALLIPMEADGGGNSSAAVSQVSHSSGTLMRDGLQLAWNGVQLLLEKAEKSLAGTPFQVPVGIINTLIELKNAVSDNNDELDSQIRRTQERLSIIKDVSDKNTGSDELMKDFAKKLADKLSDLDKMAKQATWKKILENEQNKSKIDGIFKYIDQQTKDFQQSLNVSYYRDFKYAELQMQLDNWPCSDRAMYDTNSDDVQTLSRGLCTPNTRVAILEQICHWAQDSSFNSPQVFWLTGHAGSGKSTIAYTIAHDFDEGNGVLKTLQASFFCSRQFQNTRHLKHIIPTLVYQLAHHSQIFANSLLAADKSSVNKQLTKQMQGLLIGPWKQCMQSFTSDLPPYLIVIDALDEIEGKAGAEFLKELLMAIKNGHLKGLKFLVTSRPDPELAELCNSFPPDSVCRLQDVSPEQSNDDIMTYLHSKLSVFQSTSELEELKKKANGLFIYASTAVKYILLGATLGEQHELMRQLLDPPKIIKSSESPDLSEATAPIGALYHQILSEAFQVPKNLIPTRLKILHNILCAEERISTSIAARLLSDAADKDMKERADDLVKKLHAVLYVKDDKVFWYHASFPDFLFSQAQSSEICLTHLKNPSTYDMSCNLPSHHALLSHWCFDIMQKRLHFNICNLPSSFLDDSKVPGLQTCIKEKLSGVLQYACQHWAQHIIKAAPEEHKNILFKIEKFLGIHVLFWIEAMNLLQLSKQCHLMLQQVVDCIKQQQKENDSYLMQNINEIANFAAYFTSSPAALSTPHLYLSALATWLSDSNMIWGWKKCFPSIPSLIGERKLTMFKVKIVQKGWITCVAFSPDGKSIVSGSNDQSVRVWDASSGAQLQKELNGHTGSVTSVAFSPDGKSIVSGSDDQSVRVWDASSGAQLQELNGNTGSVTSVAFSPDGKSIVSGSDDKSVRVWDASSGAQLQELNGHTGLVTSVAFSPDGKFVVSGSDDQSVRVWDASSGSQLQELNGHTGSVTSVAFSPDGKSIVSGSYDKSVRVWDASSGAQLQELNGHTSWVTSVAFSPDGKSIVSGSNDKSVRVWDASSGAQLQELNGYTDWVTSVTFSPDAKSIVSTSHNNTLKPWNTQHAMWKCTDNVTSVAFSPDGKSIVSGSDDQSVRVWDASSGAQLQELNGNTGSVTSVAFSPDGKSIVSGSDDKSVRVWDASSGAQLQELNGHTWWVTSVAFSPDGKSIVSGSNDQSVRVWDASSGAQLQELNGHTGLVTSVAFSPDGKSIVSGSDDQSVRVWDASSGAQLQELNGHTGLVTSVAFSPDGKSIVSGSNDKSVRVWDASSGAQLQELNGHTGLVTSVAFSPDGKSIVSGSYDQSVRVWDASSGAQLQKELNGHTGWVTSVAFSPDGKSIVSGSNDQSVRVWDASSGAQLQELNGHTGSVTSVAFSPDGKSIVSGSNDKSVRVWDASSGAQLQELNGYTDWVTSVTFSPDAKSIVSTSHNNTLKPWNTQHAMWKCTDNGWIVLSSIIHLMWVPDYAYNALYHPLNTLIISSHPSYHIDFLSCRFGENWTKCYVHYIL
ncbi:hypothetical protein J132_05107 [Termitomyces sp. J132]|nr:hypothetical protein J132_05107 [Termitomyces sp. J132]